MNLRDVSVFVEATESGSLSQAARKLKMTSMSASRRLAALEQDIGSRLMHRNTRSLALTPEGESFFPFAKSMLENEVAARESIQKNSGEVVGKLKVTCSAAFGRKILIPTAADFMAKNPGVEIEVHLIDALVDVVNMGLDLAIRIAPLDDSSLIARRLSTSVRALYASPVYLNRFGAPDLIATLKHHQCLTFPGSNLWPFDIDGVATSIPVCSRFSTTSMDGLHEACLSGVGIAMLSHWDVWDELVSGRLIRIDLKDAVPQSLNIWAVYPTNKQVPQRVSAFLALLRDKLHKDDNEI